MPLGQVSALADGLADAWQRHVQLDPQTPETLSRLRQTKTLALISNYDHPPYVHRLLREHKLDGFFHIIIISGAVGCKKPDPAIFGLGLQQTGLAPGQVIYVGDTQDDVQGARAAGITPVLIVRRQNPTDPALLDFRHRQDCVSEPPLNPTSALITVVIVLMENRSFDHMLGYLSLPPYNRTDVEGQNADPAWLQKFAKTCIKMAHKSTLPPLALSFRSCIKFCCQRAQLANYNRQHHAPFAPDRRFMYLSSRLRARRR
ncbi:MAG TPA: HAD-IA family hydrolase [Candidatus Binatia bacterium]|jgi:HAD superfamily hydrolase (TIGR01509 family)|nr:HAD-IA family hydrolase [Candidatus Binatia bacterium]